MSFLGRLKDRLLRRQEAAEVISDAMEDDGDFVPSNREYRRDMRRWQRKRGAGWTRPMRKGRTKRHA